jgi:hypothetical protein
VSKSFVANAFGTSDEKVCTHISLFVHQKETVVVFSKEIKSCHDIFTNVRNLRNFFWGVVIAQVVAGSRRDTNWVVVNIQ